MTDSLNDVTELPIDRDSLIAQAVRAGYVIRVLPNRVEIKHRDSHQPPYAGADLNNALLAVWNAGSSAPFVNLQQLIAEPRSCTLDFNWSLKIARQFSMDEVLVAAVEAGLVIDHSPLGFVYLMPSHYKVGGVDYDHTRVEQFSLPFLALQYAYDSLGIKEKLLAKRTASVKDVPTTPYQASAQAHHIEPVLA